MAIDNARLHDRAERSLSLLDTVFSTAPVGLALVDRELRFVRVNETFAAFNGAPGREHVGRTVPEVLRAAGHRGRGRAELRARPGHRRAAARPRADDGRRDGETRHWNASFTPVTHADGAVTGVIVSVVDVTERRRCSRPSASARARGLPRARRRDPRRVAGLRGDPGRGRADRDPRGRRLVRGQRARRRRRAAGGGHRARRRGPARARRARSAGASRPTPSADSGTYGVARSGETAYVPRGHRRDARRRHPGPRAPRARARAWACARSSSRR